MSNPLYEKIICLEEMLYIFRRLLNEKIIDKSEYRSCLKQAVMEFVPEFECLFEKT